MQMRRRADDDCNAAHLQELPCACCGVSHRPCSTDLTRYSRSHVEYASAVGASCHCLYR